MIIYIKMPFRVTLNRQSMTKYPLFPDLSPSTDNGTSVTQSFLIKDKRSDVLLIYTHWHPRDTQSKINAVIRLNFCKELKVVDGVYL